MLFKNNQTFPITLRVFLNLKKLSSLKSNTAVSLILNNSPVFTKNNK